MIKLIFSFSVFFHILQIIFFNLDHFRQFSSTSHFSGYFRRIACATDGFSSNSVVFPVFGRVTTFLVNRPRFRSVGDSLPNVRDNLPKIILQLVPESTFGNMSFGKLSRILYSVQHVPNLPKPHFINYEAPERPLDF